MRAVLVRALADADLVDQAKKALFYGKDGPLIASFREATLMTQEMCASPDYPVGDMEGGLQRLHAALGLRSEADEIIRHELTLLCHGSVARDDLLDEAGDLGWYSQLYANAIGASLLQIVRRNVAKLAKRYAGLSFTAKEASAPDKAAEAAAQAGVA